MRPIRALAAGLLLASIAVAGCSRHQSEQPTTPQGQQAVATTTPGGTTNSEPAVLADGRHPVYLKTVDPAGRMVTFDLIQFYQGGRATVEAAKDHQESPPPNDYYIRNVNPRLRTLPVAADAPITVSSLASSANPTKDTPVTLAQLAGYFPTNVADPFWITVERGQVTGIAQQHLP
jgi:hypothetical protein